MYYNLQDGFKKKKSSFLNGNYKILHVIEY